MLQIEMSDDIRKYKTKFVGPFTARQCICIFLGILVIIPVMLFAPLEEITDKIMVACVCASPIVACGYIQMDGVYLEVIFLRWLYLTVLTPSKRKNVSHNTFATMLEEIKKKEEIKKINSMTKKEYKKYQKMKEAQKIIKYYNEPNFKIYK